LGTNLFGTKRENGSKHDDYEEL